MSNIKSDEKGDWGMILIIISALGISALLGLYLGRWHI